MLSICLKLEDLANKKRHIDSSGLEDDDVDDVELNGDDEETNSSGKRKAKEDEGIASLFKKRTANLPSRQTTINQMMKKELREDVCMQIARFFYTSAILFNCVKNPEFQKMCQLIDKYGIGLNPPSYYEIREKYLKKEVDNTMSLLEEHKVEWRKSRCSFMSDGWTDKKKRSLCNFLMNSPKGTIFFTSLDTSDISKIVDKAFVMLDDIVEQVGENVVQVITDNIANYKAADEMLMQKRKKLFWTPAAHCIDLMLKDFEKKNKLHNKTIVKGRKRTIFIYSMTLLITMLKHFTKGKELIRPTITRFATAYLTLGCLFDNRNALNQWKRSRFAGIRDGKYVERIVIDSRFWASVNSCLRAAYPLIKVFHMVYSDEKPTMGFIYD
ncbi:hypothetical protein Cni_G17025 [Canna indica]|uniref:DUF659 domain-containing protein n=1 Tax=Canna indica TaxID=4628 RepID=A0AAQ3KHP7_9LILI|nr:hypothetical protein Cni_G17025 [Canna indica]